MRTWTTAVCATRAVLSYAVVDNIKAAALASWRTGQSVLGWHRHRMACDPLYPVALAAGGGALIQVLVPSAAVGHALRTVLHTLLGTSTAGMYGGRYRAQDDRWEDD